MTRTRAQRSTATGSARHFFRWKEAPPLPPVAEPSSPHPMVTTDAQIAAIVQQMNVLTEAIKSLQQQQTQPPQLSVEQPMVYSASFRHSRRHS